MKKYVVCFLFSHCRRYVYLILKNKPIWQKGRYNGVGGKIESDEYPVAACIREVKEETGLDIREPEGFLELNVSNFRERQLTEDENVIIYFFRKFLKSNEIPKSIEEEQVACFPIDKLPPNIIINLHWMIPMALIDSENNYSITEM